MLRDQTTRAASSTEVIKVALTLSDQTTRAASRREVDQTTRVASEPERSLKVAMTLRYQFKHLQPPQAERS